MVTYTRILSLFCVASMMATVKGHGRLMEPPSRGSMWRSGYNNPINYDDNALYCGGFYQQWEVNNGSCGVCGDPYNDAQPRDHEGGGKYGKGLITRYYAKGSKIAVTVEITANHRGYFIFSICAKNDPTTPATEACFDQHILQAPVYNLFSLDKLFIPDTTLQVDGDRIRWILPQENPNTYTMHVQLPPDLECQHCVLRWKWRAGNNWGTENGRSGIGLGRQEHFYGCADVAVGVASVVLATPRPVVSENILDNGIYACVPVGEWIKIDNMIQYCIATCKNGPITKEPCDGSFCACTLK